MLRVGLIGWRGMVGSVLLQRMREENDFARIRARSFFSTSNVGGVAPREANGAPLLNASNLKDLAACDVLDQLPGWRIHHRSLRASPQERMEGLLD